MEQVNGNPSELPSQEAVITQVSSDRLNNLEELFIDLADNNGSFEPATADYIANSGNLRLILNEIEKLSEKPESEKNLDERREDYVNRLLRYPAVIHRAERIQTSLEERSAYIAAFVMKMTSIIDAKTAQDALMLRQIPTIVEQASFRAGTRLSFEDFAANHLYLLLDAALKEHAARRQLIDGHNRNTAVGKVLHSRVLRLGIAGGVLVASLTPSLHFIPIHDPKLAEDANLSVQALSAAVFGVETPEEVRWHYLDIKHKRRTRKLHEQLAESKQTSDLALRMVYNSTRYGGSAINDTVTDRCGTDDKDENLRRFRKLDDEIPHLNNDPGGKPYNGEQALGYAARLLIERKGQLEHILTLHGSPTEQRELFLELTKEILVEDITRMEKGLTSSRFRRKLLRVVGIVPAVIFSANASLIGGAVGLGHDVGDSLTPQQDQFD